MSVLLYMPWPLGLASLLLIQVLPEATPEFKRGRELAQKYCASCHLYTEPALLDKATWQNGTMPFLRSRLGIDKLDPSHPDEKVVLEEWNLVWRYYFEAAPEQALPQPKRAAIRQELKAFTVVKADYRPSQRFVTLTRIDPQARRIYVGNGEAMTLDVLDEEGRLLSSLGVESPPVGLEKRPGGWFCTLIGRVPPHDQRLGKLLLLDKTGDAFAKRAELLSNLPRPTDCAFGDLNGDGQEDLILSGFGNVLGELVWHAKQSDGSYTRHVIYDRPGAVRTEVFDFNRDGHLDLMVLMAQAKEAVYILINDGQGEFIEFPILEQHPVWGYAGFQLVDFNQDGFPDILTANGDNGEYPSCLKNYHGVRLYLNDGRNRFHEAFFYPQNGAFKALAADYDQDGDLDIAAISYFPDYEQSPEESFVYLQNRGGLDFEAFTFPQSTMGRWLVMDAGDVDGDGDLDIVLGAANRTPYKVSRSLYEQWQKAGPTILILKNNLRDQKRRDTTEAPAPLEQKGP